MSPEYHLRGNGDGTWSVMKRGREYAVATYDSHNEASLWLEKITQATRARGTWKLDFAPLSGGDELDRLMAAGWEPFAVTTEVHDGESKTYVWLRKQEN